MVTRLQAARHKALGLNCSYANSPRTDCMHLLPICSGAPGFDCVLGNAAVYYPMLKDPKKFRLGFHLAGAEALAVNRMGSEVSPNHAHMPFA